MANPLSPDPKTPAPETFGQRLRRRRAELGMTQRQVAADVELDFTYLSKLENGRGEVPGEASVRRLAGVLSLDEEELLALAGKVPNQIRERAQQDVAFARFLRRLPAASDDQLRDIYKRLDP